jgi:uncharacterized flavoprotein (TIGR03862 family)
MSPGVSKRSITVVGAGPAALLFACFIDTTIYDVTIYEKNNAAGRKFLVAGDGGLNLTHSEDAGTFITRFTPPEFLENAFEVFNNLQLLRWFEELGIKTYVGSSGRIFPERNIKPIEVLNRIVEKVEQNQVVIRYRHDWKGWSDEGTLLFGNVDGEIKVKADLVVFALGGASWPVTGSKGDWLNVFQKRGIHTSDFRASNCSLLIEWPHEFISKYEGVPLKNIVIACGEMEHEGEAVITKSGIEGSGIYPLSPAVRDALERDGVASLYIDLKPTATESEINKKLNESKGRNLSEKLRDVLNLSHAQLALLKSHTSKEDFVDAGRLIKKIKKLPVLVTGLGPIEDAISTVGGISLDAIDKNFMLKKMTGTYAIGEMLDYDAPTGGYLLQSCFSMGFFVADLLNRQRSLTSL